jgi:transposase
MMAIWQRLRDNYGYSGSYWSVRRFVSQLAITEPEAYTRVHTGLGEEMQVDFGTVGPLYDPESGKIRTAYVFVATLYYSRHQLRNWSSTRKWSPGSRCTGEPLSGLAGW